MVTISKALKSCTLAAAIFLSFFDKTTAQDARTDDLGQTKQFFENLYVLPHWEVFLSPNMNAKAKLVHFQYAKYQLMTAPQLSYEFGIQRMVQLNTRLGLNIGVHFGLVGRNAAYIVPSEEIGLSGDDEYPFNGPIARERDVTFFSFPAQLEYRTFCDKRHLFLLNGGLSLRLAPLNGTSNGDMSVMEVQLRGNKHPFINMNAGAAIGFVLNNQDILKIGLNLNCDPSYIARGEFILDTNSSTDQGSYTVKGSSFGLTLVYARTLPLRD
jgi:hypothetical protein